MVFEDAHALVIGISRYLHLPVLHPTQDAQDIAAVLQKPRVLRLSGGGGPYAVR